MTWGFEATNANGQVLVSSETRNLHFVGKATLNRIIKQFNGYGGLRHYAFRIACNVTPVPFFSMPTSDYYAVAAIRTVSAGVWEIEVIRSGTSSTIPQVYVFSDPRGTTARNTNYGMLVLRNDGTPSFDSRLSPLAVTGGTSVAPPRNPLTVPPPTLSAKNCSADPGAYMKSNNQNRYSFAPSGAKPIFFFPSIAQAQRQFDFYEKEEECDGLRPYGVCVGSSREFEWWSYYWAFYRGAIKQVGPHLFCGWITADFGCNWKYKRTESISVVVGEIGVGGGSGSGGEWPYTNETLNLTPTAVITANGARYD